MEQSSIILVCFAVKEEARPFARLAAPASHIHVLVTGMGRTNASREVEVAMSTWKPALVLTAGFAGGLKPGLAGGTVLFQADPGAGLEPCLLAAGAVPASFYCSDRVAVTAAEKSQLWTQTTADAVEMESEAIRCLCRARQVPAATVRVVLDPADQDLPLDFNALMTADKRIKGRRLGLAIARSPGRISALLRFQKQTRAAAAALAEALFQTLSRLPQPRH